MEILAINSVSKYFGGNPAVDNVTASIEEGQITCIIGPNGAGKTTLFNLISGGENLSGGEIRYKGKVINKLKPHQIHELGIARTFQNIRIFSKMSVIENVMVGMQSTLKPRVFQIILPWTRKKLERSIYDASLKCLEQVRLIDRQYDEASALTYGQQRKLEIARALGSNPDLVLLDEPAAGMNINESKELLQFIKWIKTDLGKTVVVIEHNMRVVMSIADKIIVLDHGKKIADASPEEVQHDPAVIEAYLGRADMEEGN